MNREVASRQAWDRLVDALNLAAWQVEALEAWRTADRTGVIAAFAGTTGIGVAAVADAATQGRRAVVLTHAPRHVEPWREALATAFPDARLVTTLRRETAWDILVTTPSRLSGESPLRPREKALLIADEFPVVSTAAGTAELASAFSWRLGLTGDPTSYELDESFPATCFALGYARAVDEGILTPYRVALVPIPLPAPDARAYAKHSHMADGAANALASLYGITGRPEVVRQAAHAMATEGPEQGRHLARRYLYADDARRALIENAPGREQALADVGRIVRGVRGAVLVTGTLTDPAAVRRVDRALRMPAEDDRRATVVISYVPGTVDDPALDDGAGGTWPGLVDRTMLDTGTAAVFELTRGHADRLRSFLTFHPVRGPRA